MSRDDAADLLAKLTELRTDLLDAEDRFAEEIERVPASQSESARNLVHYLALRRHDVRSLQEELERMGLSSIGRSEAHVLGTINAVIATLRGLVEADPERRAAPGALTIDQGRSILQTHAVELLGPDPPHRDTAIMVTLPSDARDDRELVRVVVDAGADLVRINCAHDDEDAWMAMIDHVRDVGAEAGRRVRVFMDLAGPKLRTGPLAPGPRVLKVRPERDVYGRVVAPGVTSFRREGVDGDGDAVTPPLGLDPWPTLFDGDEIRLRDARGRKRKLRVTRAAPGRFEAVCDQTVYFAEGMKVGGRDGQRPHVRGVPELQPSLRLAKGDGLLLTRGAAPGDASADVPRIGCTLPEAFENLDVGHRVMFDDGRIVAVVRELRDDGALLEVVRVKVGGARLRSEKGINLPDTQLPLGPFTAEDRQNLRFVAAHADIVGMSFVRTPDDIHALLAELERLHASHLGVVAKIETEEAFRALPRILLALLAADRAGVMIARGDLAVESGYERLAELQEEILWLCESAHLPAIWATQVLEGMAKTGTPSRAEVTDAAMAVRAECVMLNKGAFIVDAIRALDDISSRMQDHQTKKRSRLRRLRTWYADDAADPNSTALAE
jgi:pyruvate kinase